MSYNKKPIHLSTMALISISKAARILKISPDTLRNWEKSGKLVPERTPGGARRYRYSEISQLAVELNPVIKRKNSLISISKAASQLGISADTLRNWEKRGLILPDRTEGGARRYSRVEVSKLQKDLWLNQAQQKAVKKETALKDEQNLLSPKFSGLRVFGAILALIVTLFLGQLITFNQLDLKELSSLKAQVADLVKSVEFLQKQAYQIESRGNRKEVYGPNISEDKLDNQKKSEVLGLTDNNAPAPIILDSESANSKVVLVDANQTLTNKTISGLNNSFTNISNQALASSKITLNAADGLQGGGIVELGGALTVSSNLGSKVDLSSEVEAVLATDKGGTGITGYTSGDLIYANSQTSLSKLNIGSQEQVLIAFSGSPKWSFIDQDNCPSCLIKNPLSEQIILASSPTTSGLVISQPTFGTVDIFKVTNDSGLIKFLNIDSLGRVIVNGGQNLGIGTSSPTRALEAQTTVSGSVAKFVNIDGDCEINPTASSLVCSSDERLKKDIQPLADSLSKILRLDGVEFSWLKQDDGVLQPGLIAQQVEKVIPEVVYKNYQGLKSVSLTGLIPYIVEAIKEQDKKIEDINNGLNFDSEGNLVVKGLKTEKIIIAKLDKVKLQTDEGKLETFTTQIGVPIAAKNDNLKEKNLADVLSQMEEEIDGTSQKASQAINHSLSLSDRIASTSATLAALSDQVSSFLNSLSGADQLIGESVNQENNNAIASETEQNLNSPEALLATGSAALTTGDSAKLANLQIENSLSSFKINSLELTVSNLFKSLGQTLLGNTTIAGDLTQDGTLSISDGNTINVIGGNCQDDNCSGILYLQNSPLADGVDFFNGLVTIDNKGNINAQTVTVAEFKVRANKVSGASKILANTKSIIIENPVVNQSSRILITPTNHSELILAVTKKEDNNSFTVSTSRAPFEDINFDWWLINEVAD